MQNACALTDVSGDAMRPRVDREQKPGRLALQLTANINAIAVKVVKQQSGSQELSATKSRIILALAYNSATTITEIAKIVGIEQSSCSRQIEALRKEKWVEGGGLKKGTPVHVRLGEKGRQFIQKVEDEVGKQIIHPHPDLFSNLEGFVVAVVQARKAHGDGPGRRRRTISENQIALFPAEN